MKKKFQFVYPAIFVQPEDEIMMQAIFPDLNIYTDGKTLADAYLNAKDLLKVYFSYAMQYDTEFNTPSKIEHLIEKSKPGEVVLLVDVMVEVD